MTRRGDSIASVPLGAVTPLLTAAEAYPALERLFLEADRRIVVGFRIFDPETRLHSPEGRAIGTTWFDLLVATLRRGVRLTVIVSDFDAIVRPDYHMRAQHSVRMLVAAAEAAGRPDLLDARASLHPARVGWLPSLFLWPRARGYLLRTAVELNSKNQALRDRHMAEMPQLWRFLGQGDDGKVFLHDWKMPRLTAVTHHQKVAVFDEKRLYIGGLDLNDRRYDDLDHARPGDETWHDVQLLIEGAVAAETQRHLLSFEDATRGTAPPPTPGLLRTLSRRRKSPSIFMSPVPVLAEIAGAHRRETRRAGSLLYFESQFFRDTSFARSLARQARRAPGLGLVLILPAAPEDVAFKDNSGSDARYGEYLQAKCIRILRRAFGDRLFIGSPAQRCRAPAGGRATTYGAPLVYLHAKVSIFDDTAAIVSSANLNGRSFRWDTEAGVTLTDPGDVALLRDRCLSHWLDGPVPDAFRDPSTAIAAWTDHARANAGRPPEDRDGYILPYSSAPARRFGRNLPGIPEEMV